MIEYQWFDFVGNIGVFLILLAYMLLQLEKIDSKSLNFSLINAAGAAFVIVSLLYKFNLSAFVIEAFWLAISLVGIFRILLNKRKSASN